MRSAVSRCWKRRRTTRRSQRTDVFDRGDRRADIVDDEAGKPVFDTSGTAPHGQAMTRVPQAIASGKHVALTIAAAYPFLSGRDGA
jgi:hypothetical protein